MTRVAITGLGFVTPGGTDAETLWDHVCSGRSAATPIERFDARGYPVTVAGVVGDGDWPAPPPRVAKRMDRFSQLAVVAADRALADSGLPLDHIHADRTGVSVGNVYGGWGITEPSLRSLLRDGYEAVSPYVASAWFPTAAQGQITIKWQLKGYSKTFAADTASSALAIGYAGRAIQQGRASAMVCGGTEAPVTPYTYTFCARDGRMKGTGYRPFDVRAEGFNVGEGAAMLVLEDFDAARDRGAHIYAELAGWSTARAPRRAALGHEGIRRMASTITRALADAGVERREVDYIALDGHGIQEADEAEVRAVVEALGDQANRVLCSTTKSAMTHLLGAATAVETVTTILSMQHGAVPPISGCDRPMSASPLQLATDGVADWPIRTAVVNARGADGVYAALVLRAA